MGCEANRSAPACSVAQIVVVFHSRISFDPGIGLWSNTSQVVSRHSPGARMLQPRLRLYPRMQEYETYLNFWIPGPGLRESIRDSRDHDEFFFAYFASGTTSLRSRCSRVRHPHCHIAQLTVARLCLLPTLRSTAAALASKRRT